MHATHVHNQDQIGMQLFSCRTPPQCGLPVSQAAARASQLEKAQKALEQTRNEADELRASLHAEQVLEHMRAK